MVARPRGVGERHDLRPGNGEAGHAGGRIAPRCRMNSRRLMTLQVVVPPPQMLGAVPHGRRVIAPITSGSFEGPRLRGKVLPGGGDWTLLRSDGVLELDLRITLETDDGALISMTSLGLRQSPRENFTPLALAYSVVPFTKYFRTAPTLEPSA